MRCPRLICLPLVAVLATFAAGQEYEFQVPAGLPSLRVPSKNKLTTQRVQLGKQLFFDPRLSVDDTVSCASCHDPKHGWSNGERFATGVRGQKGGRSAPTIVNAGYSYFQFWDGRAIKLEGQALGPIENPIEMDLPLEKLVPKLRAIAGYRQAFEDAYGELTPDTIAAAIASFERTILSGDAPYDRYVAGDKKALSAAAARGLEVFNNKAACSACHPGPKFTDGGFHNIGVGMDRAEPDLGRFAVSKLGGDRGSFKTPTLREIARTAPYMHDGSEKTLEDVVAYYVRGGNHNPTLDEELRPLKLTDQEQADLVTFLKEGLSSSSYPDVKPPELPK